MPCSAPRSWPTPVRTSTPFGLFDDIRITLDTTRSTDGDGTTNVNVAVVEGTSNELRTKVGYGTLDCFRLQLQASRAAILAKPGRFEATLNLSKVAVGAPLDFAPGIRSGDVQADPYSQRLNYYVGGTYAIPALGNRRWAKSVSLYTERRSEFLAYLKTTYLGGSASLTRKYGRHWSGALAYDLSYARTEAEPAVLCATFSACLAADREQFTEALPFGLASILTTFDDTDVPLDPTRGKSLRVELRIAPQWLGTAVRQQVAGARLNAAAYYPIAERTVSGFSRTGRRGHEAAGRVVHPAGRTTVRRRREHRARLSAERDRYARLSRGQRSDQGAP